MCHQSITTWEFDLDCSKSQCLYLNPSRIFPLRRGIPPFLFFDTLYTALMIVTVGPRHRLRSFILLSLLSMISIDQKEWKEIRLIFIYVESPPLINKDYSLFVHSLCLFDYITRENLQPNYNLRHKYFYNNKKLSKESVHYLFVLQYKPL